MKKKHRDYLIVDGYNIINAWESLKELSLLNLEEAREKLNVILEEYASYKGVFTIVVYDAYNVRGVSNRERTIGNLKVVYTKEKQTADSYIEKLITDLGPKKHLNVVVATDDMAEQQIALGKGGARISTRELWIEVQSSKDKIKMRTTKPSMLKNTLEGRIQEEVLQKLEAIRRQK